MMTITRTKSTAVTRSIMRYLPLTMSTGGACVRRRVQQVQELSSLTSLLSSTSSASSTCWKDDLLYLLSFANDSVDNSTVDTDDINNDTRQKSYNLLFQLTKQQEEQIHHSQNQLVQKRTLSSSSSSSSSLSNSPSPIPSPSSITRNSSNCTNTNTNTTNHNNFVINDTIRHDFMYSLAFANDINDDDHHHSNKKYGTILYRFSNEQQQQINYSHNQLLYKSNTNNNNNNNSKKQQTSKPTVSLSLVEEPSVSITTTGIHDSVSLDTIETSETSTSTTHFANPTTTSTTTTAKYDTMPLPTTIDDAIRSTSKRAMIVTEAVPPYRIVQVNKAWTQLCGYTYVEAVGQTIGSLLHGPLTNRHSATTLLNKLVTNNNESDIGTILTNYKKDGTPFINRVRLGPIYDSKLSTTKPAYYVGLVQDISSLSSSSALANQYLH